MKKKIGASLLALAMAASLAACGSTPPPPPAPAPETEEASTEAVTEESNQADIVSSIQYTIPEGFTQAEESFGSSETWESADFSTDFGAESGFYIIIDNPVSADYDLPQTFEDWNSGAMVDDTTVEKISYQYEDTDDYESYSYLVKFTSGQDSSAFEVYKTGAYFGGGGDNAELPDSIVSYSGYKLIRSKADPSQSAAISIESNTTAADRASVMEADLDQMQEILDSFTWE